MCARFLVHHATPLHSGLRAGYTMSNLAALGEYDKLLQGKPASGVSSGQGFKKRMMGGGGERRRIFTMSDPTATFFINAHHKAIFQQVYPTHYTAFFGPGAMQRGTMHWQNQYRRLLHEEARTMGEGHTRALAHQLTVRATATNSYLGQPYVMAVVNNGLT
jgi:hypothetical protein